MIIYLFSFTIKYELIFSVSISIFEKKKIKAFEISKKGNNLTTLPTYF